MNVSILPGLSASSSLLCKFKTACFQKGSRVHSHKWLPGHSSCVYCFWRQPWSCSAEQTTSHGFAMGWTVQTSRLRRLQMTGKCASMQQVCTDWTTTHASAACVLAMLSTRLKSAAQNVSCCILDPQWLHMPCQNLLLLRAHLPAYSDARMGRKLPCHDWRCCMQQNGCPPTLRAMATAKQCARASGCASPCHLLLRHCTVWARGGS